MSVCDCVRVLYGLGIPDGYVGLGVGQLDVCVRGHPPW